MPRPLALAWLLAAAAGCAPETYGFPDLTEPTYPSVAEVTAEVSGLPLREFYDRSFVHLLRRSPETLTDLGLSASLGLRDDLLDDVSDPFLQQTYELARALRDLLRAYDAAGLPGPERAAYDAYDWFLDDLVREQPYFHHVYSLNAGLTSEHLRLLSLFTQVHPLATRANAEDYVRRLWQVRRRADRVVEGLRAREREGLLPPAGALRPALQDLAAMAEPAVEYTAFHAALEAALPAIPADDDARSRLLAEADAAIEQSVLPGLRALADEVRRLLPAARAEDGVWALPGGDAWYAHLLRHHTTTELGAEEIHALGLAEVARIQARARELLVSLGHGSPETMGALFTIVDRDAGKVSAELALDRYREIIRAAQARLGEAFDVQPRAAVEVREDPVGGYYVPGSADGSRPGVFYARVPARGVRAYAMRTLAYHEAVPGHHLQCSLAREAQGLPLFRTAVSFTAHAEGWALYAERLAADLGWYEGDPLGDLGRLHYELFRAARLVVDTGLHAKRWNAAQAAAWMQENTGFATEVVWVPGEVQRYVSWPGQATAYKVGAERLLAAREAARAKAGASFDLRAFHRVVLQGGSLPLAVLERLVAASP